jgi:flagellar biosynthetic protein FliR
MGLGFATLIDQQQGTPVPVLGQFLMLITLLLFMALDGHLAFLELLMKSFAMWPPGTVVLTPDAAQILLKSISGMLGAAMRIAMPAVIALLVVQIAMGVISRSSPSMNLFAVGFPITMLVGFIVIKQVLPSLAPILEDLLSTALTQGGVLMEAADVR